MVKRKTRAGLEIENRFLRERYWTEAIASVANTVTKWGALVLIAFFGYRAVDVLAGQETLADIGIRFLADIRVSTAVGWLSGLLGVGYGIRQRALRYNTIERLQTRIRELESAIDPKRSSSKLTTRGQTRPEDEL